MSARKHAHAFAPLLLGLVFSPLYALLNWTGKEAITLVIMHKLFAFYPQKMLVDALVIMHKLFAFYPQKLLVDGWLTAGLANW